MTRCEVAVRIANDKARGVTTSARAIGFVRRCCPCPTCYVRRRLIRTRAVQV